MGATKKQLKKIKQVEKKVSELCDTEIKPKKTVEVTLDDKGVIVNKETGKPHFEHIDIDEMMKLVEEKKQSYRDVSVSLSFDKKCEPLKIQLKRQGFKIPKEWINNAEQIRADLLALKDVGILKEKELIKCFKRLSMQISKAVVESLIEVGEVAVHKETIHNK